MTIFQKLFWLKQMGVRELYDETSHNRYQSCPKLASVQPPKMNDTTLALSKTALHPLNGTGVRPAHVMGVLTMPNANEDRTGECLVGAEGEMLKKMLLSIGLDLSQNTFVGYVSPWRAPGNRLLTPVEISECRKLFDQQLQQIQPQYLLLFGTSTVRCLFENKTLAQLRHQPTLYQNIPTYATYAPDWLMKHPDDRRLAWEDLKNFKKQSE